MALRYDIFISHATEDKSVFVDPLAQELRRRGLHVWYDRFALTIGDRLTDIINEGLSCSRFGAVVLSENFLKKEWPKRELSGLLARENDGTKVILPIWHGISRDALLVQYPELVDRVAAQSSEGIAAVADAICAVVLSSESVERVQRSALSSSPLKSIPPIPESARSTTAMRTSRFDGSKINDRLVRFGKSVIGAVMNLGAYWIAFSLAALFTLLMAYSDLYRGEWQSMVDNSKEDWSCGLAIFYLGAYPLIIVSLLFMSSRIGGRRGPVAGFFCMALGGIVHSALNQSLQMLLYSPRPWVLHVPVFFGSIVALGITLTALRLTGEMLTKLLASLDMSRKMPVQYELTPNPTARADG